MIEQALGMSRGGLVTREREEGGAMSFGVQILVERGEGRLLASVRGPLIGVHANRVEACLAEAIAEGPAPLEVRVDLRGCRIIDSLGLRALRAAAGDLPLVLTRADPFVEIHLQLLGAAALMQTTPRPGRRASARPGARQEPAPPPPDRRRHRRVRAEHPVELRLEGCGVCPFSATTCDASGGGLGLRPSPALRRILTEALRGAAALEVRCPSLLGAGWTRCRTVLHRGLGLEFADLTPASRASLRDLYHAA